MNARIDSLPFARIALTIAIGCALAACGGGGGDSSSSGSSAGGARAQTGSSTHLAGDTGSDSQSRQGGSDGTSAVGGASNSRLGDGSEGSLEHRGSASMPFLDVPEAITEADMYYLAIREQLEQQFVIEARTAPEFPMRHQGFVTDTNGARHGVTEWINRVVANCPTNSAMPDENARASAHLRCMAGTYEGIDSLTHASCRTTLKADGTVIHQNGATTLPAFNVKPEHVGSSLEMSYGHPSLLSGNYKTNVAFGRFFVLSYFNGEIPKLDSLPDLGSEEFEDEDEYGLDVPPVGNINIDDFSRYEWFSIKQENLDPANGPTMIRNCVLSYRVY